MGAVLIRAGNVVSAAPNAPRNPPWMVDGIGSSTHAEIAALRRLKGSAEGAVAYVARVNRAGFTRLARPCSECYTALMEAGVRTVVYTVHEDGFGTESLRTL